MEHAEIGPIDVNHVLTTLSIAAVNEKTLRNREKKIGLVMEAVVKSPSEKAADKELEQTSQYEAGIFMLYDMGWQKRGCAMNSLTGVGHGVGSNTGEVIANSCWLW